MTMTLSMDAFSVQEMDEATAAALALTQPIEEIEISSIIDPENDNDTICNQDSLAQVIFTFTCDICQGKFNDQFGFFEHLKSHYDSQQTISPPKARSSGRKRGKAAERGTPKKAKQGDPEEPVTYPCLQCGKEFKRSHTLKIHMRNIHSISDPQPTDSSQQSEVNIPETSSVEEIFEELVHESSVIAIKTEANRQGVEVEDGSYGGYVLSEEIIKDDDDSASIQQCARCGDIFESQEDLDEHTLEEHGEEQDNSEAATGTRSKSAASRRDTLKCSECDRVFNHRNSLVYHMRSHTGERPHTCAVCEKSFFATSALKVHMRLHSGEKPYTCEHCGRCFRQWGDLTYHVISIHSDVRQYQCEYCGKDFARKYSLVVHRRIHTGERNYVCEYCNKSFRAASYLQNHRRIHTGEKPHECEICRKPFRVRSDMKRHMSSHSREKGQGSIAKRDEIMETSTPSNATPAEPKASPVASPAKKTPIIIRPSPAPPKRKPTTTATVNVHNIVAVNEAGEIVALEPELARQLQEGQIIHVPVSATGSINLAHSSLRQMNLDNSNSVLITGDVSNGDQMTTLEEEDPTAVKNEMIYQETQQIAISEQNICDANSGTLYVWPVFMSGS